MFRMLNRRLVLRVPSVYMSIVPRQIAGIPPDSLPKASPGVIESIKHRFGYGLRYSSLQLHASGENMFAVCAEYPDFKEFVTKLGLPDTFQSWFSLTTLHIWMCLVRLRREGQEGRILKETFIKLIWIDLKGRMRGFGIIRKQHDHVEQFNMQFFGSLFAYDEAFLKNSDAALSAALWRNFFLASPLVSAVQLETMVRYIRKQLAHLDSIPNDIFLGKGFATFLRLQDETLKNEYALQRLRYCLTWPSWAQ
ncbi:unnamed protein product [Schistocephalus solidus]|uniref:Ubiq_cyt_C_chap domain-containing protein n=1 Tax=Schistocephalus solidus TaxID=70667 RepID=A0A183SIG2_SCHSO|nr:unnamed protein product [Schistocephalus solidus]